MAAFEACRADISRHTTRRPTCGEGGCLRAGQQGISPSGKIPSVTGNPAAFAERNHMPESGSYGIEAFHFTKDVDKDTKARIRIATALLREPEFSGMRCWAEYQRLKNANQEQGKEDQAAL